MLLCASKVLETVNMTCFLNLTIIEKNCIFLIRKQKNDKLGVEPLEQSTRSKILFVFQQTLCYI